MSAEFIQYQTFLTSEAAQPLLALLSQQQIPFETSSGQQEFDVSFAYNATRAQFAVKLRPQDFETARALETAINEQRIAETEPDQYLFTFTDDELFDILAKPDEWSSFDVTLAQQLLQQRGRNVSADAVQLLRQNRLAALAQPEESQKIWIMAGYLFALLGGLLGLLIGWHLSSHNKVLPDGRQLPAYSEADRAHGRRILGLSCLGLIGSMLLRFWAD